MKYQTSWLKCLSVLACAGISHGLHAQDSTHISLPAAEQRFIHENLSLLAGKYDIDIAKAAVIQARLYNNPVLSFSGSLYDPENKKFFNVSNSSGQYDWSVQQLIQLAGKRNKAIKLSETNVNMSENRFFDLLRTLRFTLRSNFFDLYYLQRSLTAYDKLIASLQTLNNSYQELQVKAVVTQKDALRIKALLYSLMAERTDLQNQLGETESSLKLLLQDNKSWYVADSVNDPATQADQLNLQSLIDTAYANRYDLKLAANNVLYNTQNYQLQKALAKPDITLGAEFDKRGSFVNNASFLTMAIELPFFHRNQGNIKAAKFSIDQSKLLLTQQQQLVENEVQAAYSKLLNTARMLQTTDPGFPEQMGKMLQGISDNLQKRNISLVDFADFCESYKSSLIQYNQLLNQHRQAAEALNYAMGKTILNN